LTGLMAGCGAHGSPTDLQSPLRNDPLVVDRPQLEPPQPIPPGKLEESILLIGKDKEQGGVGGKALDPTKISPEHRAQMRAALDEMFGTPAEPTVNVGKGSDIAELELDDATL